MKKQCFPIFTLHFNLRSPGREDRPTPIYAVVRHEGQQHKFSTGVKVLPRYWIPRFEVCLRSPMLSPLANENATVANEVLRQIRVGFSEFRRYLCEGGVSPALEDVKRMIFKTTGMEKRQIKKPYHTGALTLLRKALQDVQARVRDGSKSNYETKFNSFLEFLEERKIGDTVDEMCNEETLHELQRFLVQKKTGPEYNNGCCKLIGGLMTQCVGQKIEIKLLPTPPSDKKRMLTDEEISLLQSVELPNEYDDEVRDFFLMECFTGQRISDLPTLFEKNLTYTDIEGFRCVQIQTRKEMTSAYIIVTPEVNALIQKYVEKGGFRKLNIHNPNQKSLNTLVNNRLKKIAKKAGLNAQRNWKEAQGDQVISKSAPLYKILSSHWGRHTFVTKMLLNGVSPDVLCALTGHADDEMIKKVYSHVNSQEKTANAIKQLTQNQALPGHSEPTPPTAKTPEAIKGMLSELERDELVIPEEFPVPIPGDPYHQRIERKGEFKYNGVRLAEGSEAYEKRMRALFSEFRTATRGESETSLRQLLTDVADIRREFEVANNLDVLESVIFSLQNEKETLRTNRRSRQDLEGYRFDYEVKRSKLYFFDKVEKHLKNRLKTFPGVQPSTPDGRDGH